MTDDLSELSGLWRQDEGPSFAELPRLVRRGARWARWSLMFEAGAAVAGLAAGVWVAWRGHLVIGLAAAVFSLFGLAVALWARARSGRIETGSVAAELETSIRQAAVAYRAAWGGLLVCAASLLFLAAFALATPASDRLNVAMAAAMAWVAAYVGLTAVLIERARLRRERLLALRALLADGV